MGRQVSTTSAPKPLTLREAGAKIEALHGRLEEDPAHRNRYFVPRAAAASTIERQQLSAVRARLEERLSPCEDALTIEAVISQFLIGFEQGKGGSDLNTAALNERYVKALIGKPLAAIEAAIERFDADETLLPWNRTFRPTPPQLCAEVREGLVPLRTRLIHLRRVLDAEVYDPPTEEQKAKVADIAAGWRDMRSASRADGRPTPAPEEIAQARESHLHELGARVVEAADVATMDRLMGRIEARAPRQDEEVGA